MRMLFVCGSYGGGGAERVAVNLATEFERRGHNVTYFYRDDQLSRSYEVGAQVNLIRSPSRSLVSSAVALRKTVRRASPDVVIGFTDVSNILAVYSSAFRRSGPKVIATVHTNVRERDKNISGSLKFQAVRILGRLSCRLANMVVAVSEGARAALQFSYGVPPEKLVAIYNPVLRDVASPQDRLPLRSCTKLVAVGRLTEAKDYPLMLQTVRHLIDRKQPIHLTVYGEGELRKRLELIISELELSRHVTLAGFVGDLPTLLPRYNLFLMTSRWEGFGNVLVEALNAGLPVVAAACPSGPSEILGDGKYGKLVDSRDPIDFADAVMEELHASVAIRSDVVLRQEHLQKFTLSTVSDQYERVIARVVGEVAEA